MSWAWLALMDERPDGADAAATCARSRASPPACWPPGGGTPSRCATPGGSTRGSSTRTARRRGSPSCCRRTASGSRSTTSRSSRRAAICCSEPFDAVTTLLTDDSHFQGSLLVARGRTRGGSRDDPFARVFPARVLHVGAGVLGRVPWPAGPVIERYGSAQPWPADRYG